MRAFLIGLSNYPKGGSGVFIRGAYIEGEVDLNICNVDCVLEFYNCTFEKKPQMHSMKVVSLLFDGSKLPGIYGQYLTTKASLFLRNGFESDGMVDLIGARIGGALECQGAKFRNPGGIAFNGQHMTVNQGFLWRQVAEVSGRVDLVDAQVTTLADDMASWLLPSDIVLDGFVYNRIHSKDMNADSRVRWIKRQVPELFGDKIWPQPWEHLTKVLREMGYPEESKLVAMEKQREMRRKKLIGSRRSRPELRQPFRAVDLTRVATLNGVSRLLHRAFGALAGYGYRPLRTFMLMMLIWLAAAGVFTVAEARGLFVPSAMSLLTDSKFRACGPRAEGGIRWTRCPDLPRYYTTFDPLMYSLDAILPLVDLKQEGDWEPLVRRGQGWEMWDGLLVRGVMWVEILFGWIGSLLIVSALGRLVQKD